MCVVALKKGQLKILSCCWNRNLGGRDYDEVLFEHFAAEFKQKTKLDVKNSPKACFRLRTNCEKVIIFITDLTNLNYLIHVKLN